MEKIYIGYQSISKNINISTVIEFVLTKEYANRRIWEIINLDNPNPQAVEIGNRTLATICRKLHIEMLTDYSQLLDTPIMLVVGIKKDA